MNRRLVQPSDEHKLFAVYHHHEWGSTQYALWATLYPSEQQVVESLGIDFEPERDEFIAIEEITSIATLVLA